MEKLSSGVGASWTPEDVEEQAKEWARIAAKAGEDLSTTEGMYRLLVGIQAIISRAEKDPEWNPREDIIDAKESVTILQESLSGQMSEAESLNTLMFLLAVVESD